MSVRKRQRRRTAQVVLPAPDQLVARLLALPVVDRALERLLAHPRVLQVVASVVGLLLVVLALYPLGGLLASAGTPPSTRAALPSSPTSSTDEQAAVLLVAAYNQASITAALLGRADPMTPYLAPDSPAWTRVQNEYQRRAARGETHAPALTRWGVLRIAVTGATATVETQEQWDDVTSVGGQVLSSRRGMLSRTTYRLRRVVEAGVGWQLTDVISTVVVQ